MNLVHLFDTLIFYVKNLLILSSLFLLGTTASLASSIALDDTFDSADISLQVDLFEDPDGHLTVQDFITATQNDSLTPERLDALSQNVGKTYWVRFTAVNNSVTNERWYLTLNNNYAEALQLYRFNLHSIEKESTVLATDQVEIIKRVSNQNLPSFLLSFTEKQASTFYLRMTFDAAFPQVHLTLYSQDEMLKQSNLRSVFYAFIIGAMFVIGIYNLTLFFTLEDFSYASLSISIISMAFIFSNLNGLYQQVTGVNYINASFFNAIYLITIASTLEFLRRIIDAGVYVPLINRLLLGIEFFAIGMLVIIYWIPHADLIINLLTISIFPLILVGVFLAKRRGRKFAGSLLFVVPIYLLTFAPYILASLGLLENQLAYLNLMHVGELLVIILLSLTLSERTYELKESKKLAQAASDAKSQFLANMSHELRTPMNAVIGFSQLRKQTSLDREQKDYIDKSLGSANHMVELIDKVLDFSKFEVNKFKLESVTFKLSELLQVVVTHIEAVCKEKNIDFSIRVAPDVPLQLYADPLRLRQVLINLLNNAVKFTQYGEVTLSVRVVDTREAKALLYFSVKDTGIGIETEKYKDIFNPFTQVNTEHSRKYGGVGLGLTISQEILELMGSRVEVRSTLGKGSTFFFDVWIEQGRVTEKLIKPVSPVNFSGDDLKQLSRQNILVVEDDYLNQIVVQRMLQSMGVNVVLAGSGQTAIELLQALHFDLIFMDIQMPGKDGYETTRQIRSSHHHDGIPIIALTAHASAEDEKICLSSGMNGFLTKPIDLAVLKQILIDYIPSLKQTIMMGDDSNAEAQSNREVKESLLTVVDELGEESTKTYLQTTIQYLEESHKELQQYLDNKNLERASACAHRLKGSVNLYGTTRLNQILGELNEKKYIESELQQIQEELRCEYSIIIAHMKQVFEQLQ